MTSNITVTLIFEPLTQKYTKTNVFQSFKHKTETKTNQCFKNAKKNLASFTWKRANIGL